MNQKTAKLINGLTDQRALRSIFKQQWYTLPHNKRNKYRKYLQSLAKRNKGEE